MDLRVTSDMRRHNHYEDQGAAIYYLVPSNFEDHWHPECSTNAFSKISNKPAHHSSHREKWASYGGGTFWTVEPARHRRICCQQRRSTGFSYTVLKQFSTGPRYGNSQRSSITHSLTESGYTSHLRVLLLNYYPHFLDQKWCPWNWGYWYSKFSPHRP